jgi:hypothetical protein
MYYFFARRVGAALDGPILQYMYHVVLYWRIFAIYILKLLVMFVPKHLVTNTSCPDLVARTTRDMANGAPAGG